MPSFLKVSCLFLIGDFILIMLVRVAYYAEIGYGFVKLSDTSADYLYSYKNTRKTRKLKK